MARDTWGKCKSCFCLVLMLWYALFETKLSLLLAKNNKKENILYTVLRVLIYLIPWIILYNIPYVYFFMFMVLWILVILVI